MHLARRTYVFVLLTAVLAVAGIWSGEGELARLWRIPAALLVLGLTVEGLYLRHTPVTVRLRCAPRALLGVVQPCEFEFVSSARRPLALEYVPAVPPGFEASPAARRVRVPASGAVRDAAALLPVRLGPQTWPASR